MTDDRPHPHWLFRARLAHDRQQADRDDVHEEGAP